VVFREAKHDKEFEETKIKLKIANDSLMEIKPQLKKSYYI